MHFSSYKVLKAHCNVYFILRTYLGVLLSTPQLRWQPFGLLSLAPPVTHVVVGGEATFLSKESLTELGLCFFRDAVGLRQGSCPKS